MHEIRAFFTNSGCPKKRNTKAYNLETISPILREVFRLGLANNLIRQGRTIEAEAIVRETLLGTLKRQGKNSLIAVYSINSLASVVSAQGRHEEALQLRKAALDILAASNVPSDTQSVGSLKFRIAASLSRLGKWKKAFRR